MAVNATLNMGAVINKVVALSNVPGTSSNIDLSLNAAISLGAGTTPVVDEAWVRRLSLSAGTLTVDLTALPQTGLATLDMTGLVVYAVVLRVLAASAAMTLQGGDTNAYEVLGDAAGLAVIDPAGWLVHYSPVGFGTVGASLKDIKVTGTGTDSFDMAIVAGTP